MARRKIREFDAKRIVCPMLGLGLRAVQVTSSNELKALSAKNPWLKSEKLVAKPDMLFGQRGKNNLVLLNATLQEAEKFMGELLGKDVEVNGAKGPVTHFIVEPFVQHELEHYLSISSTREGALVRFSLSGGVQVEENWGLVREAKVAVGQEPQLEPLVEGAPADRRGKLLSFIRSCLRAFDELDLSLLEMNPFTFDSKGNPFPLDMRAEVDDTAHFRDAKKWGDLQFPQPFGRSLYPEEQFVRDLDEKSGSSLKLTMLNPNGRIWTIVAGGGASVIYADTVVDLGYGSELANYGEYSGNPNEEETYAYAKTILDLATRNPDGKPIAILIGGGIANFTDVAQTFKGIIRAIREFRDRLAKANARIFVRRGGPNYETGLALMRKLGTELGLEIDVYGPEASMTKIVPMAIEYVKAKKAAS